MFLSNELVAWLYSVFLVTRVKWVKWGIKDNLSFKNQLFNFFNTVYSF